jgi:hypothetical protein
MPPPVRKNPVRNKKIPFFADYFTHSQQQNSLKSAEMTQAHADTNTAETRMNAGKPRKTLNRRFTTAPMMDWL